MKYILIIYFICAILTISKADDDETSEEVSTDASKWANIKHNINLKEKLHEHGEIKKVLQKITSKETKKLLAKGFDIATLDKLKAEEKITEAEDKELRAALAAASSEITITEKPKKASKSKTPSPSGDNFLKSGFGSVSHGFTGVFKKKEDADGDKPLQSVVEADENQSEEEQKKSDGFFAALKNKYGRVCFRDIGCFSAIEYEDEGKPTAIARPIQLLPMSPDTINPQFHLYTIDSRWTPQTFNINSTKEDIKNSTFNATLPTAVVVHGFQSGFAVWMENLKDFIFLKSDDQYNVVVVVWEKGSKVPVYNLAASNTRVVGALISIFLNKLCEAFDYKNDRFHLIGHSLGAHTMGYAGKRLYNPQVARITGLDPAGVGFHYDSPAMRLHPSDATMVDVLHTDSALSYTEGFGTLDNLGHYDFYPNGGNWQPGCPKSQSVWQKLTSLKSGQDITCSHSFACRIINDLDKPEDDCSNIAYQCADYNKFLEGRCADCRNEKCKPMGLNPEYWFNHKPNNSTIGLRYYAITGFKEDFCCKYESIDPLH